MTNSSNFEQFYENIRKMPIRTIQSIIHFYKNDFNLANNTLEWLTLEQKILYKLV